MKKVFFILTLCSISFSGIDAQWIQQVSGTNAPLTSIHFYNENTGICVGGSSIILKTTNGGSNWSVITSPVTMNFDYVRMFSTGNIITGSVSSYTVLRTSNGGNSWSYSTVNLIPSETKLKIQFVSYLAGFFLTGGKIYKTTDSGVSWVSYSTNVSNRDMSFANENTGWICNQYTIPYPPPYGTNYSQIRRTDNGGQSWTTQVNIQEQSFAIYRIFFVNVSLGFQNSFFTPSLSRTINGGSSWSGVNGAGLYKNYYQMSFPDAATGWFIGNLMIKTTDGGLNWTEKTTQFGNQFNNIFFVNDTVGWLVGSGGLILKTTNGGEPINGVEPVPGEIPSSFSLSQNYPNPFNPVTRIKYDVPSNVKGQTSNVKIIIYDVLGREIETLVSETQKPGSYEVTWDGSRYASGVYFYKLMTDEYVGTKKMVLIK